MDALVKTAIESLVKKILPLLEQQLASVLQKPNERPTAELAYLINESRELLDLMSNWTEAHKAGKTLAPPVASITDSDDDDEAAMMLAEMDNDSTPAAPGKSTASKPSESMKDIDDDEAMAMLAEMDEAPATKAAAQKPKEVSDDEAMAMLAEMDGTAEGGDASNDEELSDDEAANLLAEIEAPAKAVKPKPAATKKASPVNMGDDEAARLLAEMEDEEPTPAPTKASAPTPAKAAAAHDAGHHEDEEDFKEIAEWEPNDFQSDPSMLNDFITNSDELMQTVDDAILRLEQEPTNKAIIEEIFRAAHTLKGGSGMFGFKGIERVMHRMENLFDLIRKEKLIPNSDTIDTVFQGIDLLRRLLQAVKEGGPCGVETASVVRALSFAAKGKPLPKSAASAAPAAASPIASAAPVTKSSAEKPAATAHAADHHDDDGKKEGQKNAKKTEQSTIRVDLERLDVLVNLIGELVIDRTRFASIEEDLRTNFPQIKLGSSFSETVQLFGRHMNEIQDIIMKVRMVPITRTLSS